MNNVSFLPRTIWILLAIYLVFAVFYAAATPVFEKPDEYLHFAFAMHVFDTGELPVQEEGDLAHQAAQQGSQPPFYYAVLAGLWRVTGVDDPSAGFAELTRLNPNYDFDATPWPDNENQFLRGDCSSACRRTSTAAYIGRGLGIAFGLLALIGAAVTMQLAFPEAQGLLLLVVGAMAFNPQFLHIASSVSNDVSTVAAVTWSMAAVLWWLRRPAAPARAILLAIPVALAALSKVSGLSIGLVAGLVFLFAANLGWKSRARQLGLFGGTVGVISGWWYWRNWRLYGEPTATDIHLEIFTDDKPEQSVEGLIRDWGQVINSFWASFGWGEINPSLLVYTLAGGVMALLLLGFLWQLPRRWRTWDHARRTLILMSIGQVLVVAVLLTRWMLRVEAPLGRLMFPALFPIVLILASSVPVSLRGLFLGAWATVPILMLGLLIVPAYRPPQPVFESQPNDVLAEFGDGALLLRDIVWGHDDRWLYMQFEWEVRRSLERDYQIFIHARGNPVWILEQRDTHPGLGHRLMSEFEPGQTIVDVYPLRWPKHYAITSFAIGFWVPSGQSWERLAVTSDHFEVVDDALQLPVDEVRAATP
ncbi:MAG: hypothetical protein GYB66_11920 [Chloroflexi bacterium]|nr:hypothetical protein [Chloroflexota bacterium]